MTIGDLQQKIYALTKTNSISYPAAQMVIDMNIAYSRDVSLIFMADGRWEWDDTNQTDLPVATAAIVANQQDYALSVSFLSIDRVEILPNGATYFMRLNPRDVEDPMWGSQLLGLDNQTKGLPLYYDLAETSVFLYPIPNYSQAASLKVYYQRPQLDFTTSDLSTGTAQPGFASIFHDLIAYQVAYDYALINLPSLANGYLTVVQKKEAALQAFYAFRNKDDSPRLSNRKINFR